MYGVLFKKNYHYERSKVEGGCTSGNKQIRWTGHTIDNPTRKKAQVKIKVTRRKLYLRNSNYP